MKQVYPRSLYAVLAVIFMGICVQAEPKPETQLDRINIAFGASGFTPVPVDGGEHIIDSATSEDIVIMLKQIKDAKDRSSMLIKLCSISCEDLTVESVGEVLAMMAYKYKDHELSYMASRPIIETSYVQQERTIREADLPWDKITGSELNENILPKLGKASRAIAVAKWMDAQAPEVMGQGATSEDIATMFKLLDHGKEQRILLEKLCSFSCESLRAQAVGDILRMMPTADEKVKAMRQAGLPWNKITGSELNEKILPKLGKNIRAIAVGTWMDAQAQEAIGKKVSASSEDIAVMLKLLEYPRDRNAALVKLCSISCEDLTAAYTGKILGTMVELSPRLQFSTPARHRREQSRGEYTPPKRHMISSEQQNAIQRADLPWDKITGPQLNEQVLPMLEPESRAIAIEKWMSAQASSVDTYSQGGK
ncbi:hypothetical protein ACFL6Y_09920 [Elusimicrobiota bacterium]